MSNPEQNIFPQSTVNKTKKKISAAKVIDRSESLQVTPVAPSDQLDLLDSALESPVVVESVDSATIHIPLSCLYGKLTALATPDNQYKVTSDEHFYQVEMVDGSIYPMHKDTLDKKLAKLSSSGTSSLSVAPLESPVAVIKVTKAETLAQARSLPKNWRYTPVNESKAPFIRAWQNNGFDNVTILSEFTSQSKAKGIGVLCGVPSGGILLLDRDGASADKLVEQFSGQNLEEALPHTVTVTSGRVGRCQHVYQVPEQYWSAIATVSYATGVKGPDSEEEQLEFFWTGRQSVLIGEHPKTGSYRWVNSPTDTEVAIAPAWMIEKMLTDKTATKQPSKPVQKPVKPVQNTDTSNPTLDDIRQALGYLSADCCYGDWRSIGMALQSQDDNLLSVWDLWSAGSTEKYKAGECEKKWATFGAGSINIYKLFQLAKQKGYQPSKSIELEMQKIDVPANSAKSFKNDRWHKTTDLELELEELEVEDLKVSVDTHLATVDRAWGLVKSSVPEDLRRIFETQAVSTGVPEMANLLTVLGSTSASVNASYRVSVPREDSDWFEALNFFVALVGDPGALKSEIVGSATKPYQEAQVRYKEAYDLADSDYNRELSNFRKNKDTSEDIEPQKPKLRLCNFSLGTVESLINRLNVAYQDHNSGILWNADEISSIFGGLNKYNGGSDDVKFILSAFNGGYTQKDLVATSAPSSRTPVSILGGIQESEWCFISRKLSNAQVGDGNGFTARFLLGLIPKTATRQMKFGPKTYTKNIVTDFVETFRNRHLDRQGLTDINIDSSAQSQCFVLEEWNKAGFAATGMKNHYAKGLSYIYRVAGMLSLWDKRDIIQMDDLRAAQVIVDYSIATDRIINHNSDTTSAEGAVSKAWQLGKSNGRLTSKMLNTAKIGTAHDRQAIIAKVAELGGRLEQNNRGTMTWFA
jgi:hypothetical protein